MLAGHGIGFEDARSACSAPVDVVFVLDGSSSITNQASGGVLGQFVKMKDHVVHAVTELEAAISSGLLRVALLSYETEVDIWCVGALTAATACTPRP